MAVKSDPVFKKKQTGWTLFGARGGHHGSPTGQAVVGMMVGNLILSPCCRHMCRLRKGIREGFDNTPHYEYQRSSCCC